EDSNFYHHGAVDYVGILRAMLIDLRYIGSGRHPMGASTITQQVAKNMLLTNKVSLARKIREAILATRLEKAMSKDRILELYLNQIYLGAHSYGVAAAALNYFNKSLSDLTIAQAAYLAALPKAPNNYDPVRDHEAAVERRNWVIQRMADTGRITQAQAQEAKEEPLVTQTRNENDTVSADYFSEEVRRQLIAKFGEQEVMEGGLAVKTSLNPKLQAAATEALRNGLIAYDRRERGWRGPVTHFESLRDWAQKLKKAKSPPGGEEWPLAVVIGLKRSEAQIAFQDGTRGFIPWKEMSWGRREYPHDKFGPPIHRPSDVLNVGDVVMVEAVKADSDGKPYPPHAFTLRQIPQVEGAIVALDPHTGRVFALSGGFSARISQFDRATQAMRQPGSSFKPFIYMAALDDGFTPATLISDTPFDIPQGPNLPLWRPVNYDGEDFGPTPLRVGIEKSQNVMTVRIAQAIGMPTVVAYAKKFGVIDDMPDLLSYALGAKETTPLRMVTAYGMIVNGGKKITPTMIDRVQDRDGKTIWRADDRPCTGCQTDTWTPESLPPDIPDTREQIEDPRTTYQMVSILHGVIERGTGRRLKDIDFPLAGKTGTTNDSKDAWFIGFTPDLVCGVYVGFDDPQTLGKHETGASVALPIFRDFILKAIKGKPAIPFRVPPGLRMVRVDPETEDLAPPSDKSAIWESFIPGTEPKPGQPRPVLGDGWAGPVADAAARAAAAANGTPVPAATSVSVDQNLPQPQPQTQQQPVLTQPTFTPPAPPPPQPAPAATTGTGGLY
ncbi:MAG: penicillin-binding protein 1A, partial [Alphaproteobacteria bacterium]|nr:penicillin-binding protein 1A [Alphaproteobacteria bacterium]